MARRRSFPRGGRQVRETLWLGIDEVVQTLASANTAALINSLNAAALALRPFTITRTVGFFGVRSDQTATSETYDGAVGMAVVSDQASAIGITAVPTPWTDLGSDLFFTHQMLMGRFLDLTAAGFEMNALTWIQYESKAMRRVNEDQDIVVTVEGSSLSAGCAVHHAARILVKLH